MFFSKTRVPGPKTRKKTHPGGCRRSPPLANFPSTPSSTKLTPLALSAPYSYMSRTILASQLTGGNTSECDCKAGIASLALPRMKNTKQSTKIVLNNGMISIITTKRILGEEGHSHPWQQDSQPLPKTHPDWPLSKFAHIIHHALSQKYQ